MPLLETNPPTFRCDACGGSHDAYRGCCGAYAIPQWDDAATLCEMCVLASEKFSMAKRHSSGESFTCYISCDGCSATTFTGDKLASVEDRHQTNRKGFGGGFADYIRVRDSAGRRWYGYGNNGMCITLRPIRGAKRKE